MPVDQLMMPFTALLILGAAMLGTTMAAAPPKQPPRHVVQPARSSLMVDCRIEAVDMKDRILRVTTDEVMKTFKISETVVVSKDQKEGDLSLLAVGDHAVLHLASAGSDMVTRIVAVSAR